MIALLSFLSGVYIPRVNSVRDTIHGAGSYAEAAV